MVRLNGTSALASVRNPPDKPAGVEEPRGPAPTLPDAAAPGCPSGFSAFPGKPAAKRDTATTAQAANARTTTAQGPADSLSRPDPQWLPNNLSPGWARQTPNLHGYTLPWEHTGIGPVNPGSTETADVFVDSRVGSGRAGSAQELKHAQRPPGMARRTQTGVHRQP
jgi:hypothetical protein